MAKESKIPSNRSDMDFKKLTEHILDSYLGAKSPEEMDILELLDDSMSVIGTGKQELFRNLKEFSQSFSFEIEERKKLHFEWKDFCFEQQDLDGTHVMVYGSVLILGKFENGDTVISMDTRYTIIYGLVDGKWKVLHIHHSVPNMEQTENEEFPRTLGRQVEESQSMIAALTSDYLNVYIVEPEKNLGTVLKLDGYALKDKKEKPWDFDYSKVLCKYADERVFAEDRKEFLNILMPDGLIRNFTDGRQKLEVKYRVPIDGRLEHFSGLYIRISKPSEPLKIIAGFRNNEDIISIQAKNRKEGLYNAYEVISDLYLAMFRINLKNNTYYSIKTTEAVRKYTLTDSDRYDENLKAIITGLADEESLVSVLEFLNADTIEERMQGKSHIVTNFQLRDGRACRLHLVKESGEEDGNLKHVVLAVELPEEDEFHSVLDILTENYCNVYWVNLTDDSAKVLKYTADLEIMNFNSGQTVQYTPALKQWIKSRVYKEDQHRLLKVMDLNYARSELEKNRRYEGNYRRIVNGKMQNFRFSYTKVDYSDYALLAFQNIDTIIKEHEASEKRERELREAYLRDEKEHNDIIRSLSNIYSTIVKVEIDTQCYEIVNSVSLMKSVAGMRGNFNDTKEAILSAFMAPDMKEQMSAFLDFNTLADRLKDVNTIAIDYKAPSGQWVQARFVVKLRDENGVAKEALYVVRDISEEKAKEQERLRKERELEEHHLQEEKEHAEVINSLSTIYSTIFVANVDTHEYEILGSVPLMSKVAPTVGNFDDVKAIIIENFMEPEFREPLSEFLDLNTLAARLEKVNTVTVDYKAPTGQWMQARFIAKRRDEEGVAREILYVARDITEEKTRDLEQQEALTHALASAQQASKAKTTFLNSMSHDIRTPMNAIIGFTALAQTHINDQEQVQDYLGKISTSSTHLLSLINDILDMSRIESGTVKLDEKPVHIPDLLHDLRTMIQGLVNSKNLNLFIDTQDVVHEDVLTDKLRLNQVLLNIVSNAVKFTQPGGDIIIRLVEKPCKTKHYTTYEFSVKDNGIGMSKEFQKHIFETFTREYSATVSGIQGTGLGMAITKNIVNMMGGDIEVESEEGKGSLFTVTINLRLADEPVKSEPIPDLLGVKALVVDDDINTCRSVSKMLRDIKMRPDWTTSGKEAIIRAQDAADMNDEYKVYIIDYLMPDMNGIETVRRIRKVIKEDVPIIVLTAYDWSDFEYEAREAGVTAFVSKPIFLSELREVLTQPVTGEKAANEVKKKTYDYSGRRVLLVEDNELNREIATALLKETGMEVDSVSDGDEAVAAIIKEPADKYDLILMDIQMPRMDGYTATREIRTLVDNKKANIPIVAMTANAFEEDKRKAFESGMNGHIIKPISIESIAVALDDIFDGTFRR